MTPSMMASSQNRVIRLNDTEVTGLISTPRRGGNTNRNQLKRKYLALGKESVTVQGVTCRDRTSFQVYVERSYPSAIQT